MEAGRSAKVRTKSDHAFESSFSSREVEGRIKRRASIENLPFWSSTERCRRDWKSRRKALLTLEDRRWFLCPPCCCRFSLSLSPKLTHLPHFLSLQILRIKRARRETQNDSVSNENAVPLPRTRAHARRWDGFTVQTKGFNFYWS